MTQIIFKDGPLGMMVLFNSLPVVTNYKKLLELDQAIANRMFDLAENGDYFKKLTPEDLERARNVLSEYNVSEAATMMLHPKSQISDGASYHNILRMLWGMTSRYKTFAATNRIKQFTNSDISNGGVTIGWNAVYTETMQSEYECARGLATACNQSVQTFIKNIGKIAGGAADDSNKALEEFKGALADLKSTYQSTKSSVKSDYEKRKKELLSTQR